MWIRVIDVDGIRIQEEILNLNRKGDPLLCTIRHVCKNPAVTLPPAALPYGFQNVR